MSIEVICGHCGWKATVKDSSAGKKGKCPTCGEPVEVPKRTQEPDDVEAAAAAALLEGDDEPAPAPPRSYSPAAMPKPYSTERPAQSSKEGPKFEYRAKERPRGRQGGGIHPGVAIGLLMMVGAAIWFFVALAAGWIFFYPPILFVLGLAKFIYGLAGRDDV